MDSADILVIDDSEIALEQMMSFLRDGGLSVIGLPSAIGATRTAIRSGVKVVVTDVNMPALPGNNLIALFRKSERLKHVKVVLVSGASLDELQALALESGADAIVTKDDLEATLLSTVRRMLRSYEAHSPSRPPPKPSQ